MALLIVAFGGMLLLAALGEARGAYELFAPLLWGLFGFFASGAWTVWALGRHAAERGRCVLLARRIADTEGVSDGAKQALEVYRGWRGRSPEARVALARALQTTATPVEGTDGPWLCVRCGHVHVPHVDTSDDPLRGSMPHIGAEACERCETRSFVDLSVEPVRRLATQLVDLPFRWDPLAELLGFGLLLIPVVFWEGMTVYGWWLALVLAGIVGDSWVRARSIPWTHATIDAAVEAPPMVQIGRRRRLPAGRGGDKASAGEGTGHQAAEEASESVGDGVEMASVWKAPRS